MMCALFVVELIIKMVVANECKSNIHMYWTSRRQDRVFEKENICRINDFEFNHALAKIILHC